MNPILAEQMMDEVNTAVMEVFSRWGVDKTCGYMILATTADKQLMFERIHTPDGDYGNVFVYEKSEHER